MQTLSVIFKERLCSLLDFISTNSPGNQVLQPNDPLKYVELLTRSIVGYKDCSIRSNCPKVNPEAVRQDEAHLELDQLIISTNAHTQKVELESIRNFINEPIVGMEGHHIVGFQLGPTEKSIYWVYFVPAQYIKKIRSAIGI